MKIKLLVAKISTIILASILLVHPYNALANESTLLTVTTDTTQVTIGSKVTYNISIESNSPAIAVEINQGSYGIPIFYNSAYVEDGTVCYHNYVRTVYKCVLTPKNGKAELPITYTVRQIVDNQFVLTFDVLDFSGNSTKTVSIPGISYTVKLPLIASVYPLD